VFICILNWNDCLLSLSPAKHTQTPIEPTGQVHDLVLGGQHGKWKWTNGLFICIHFLLLEATLHSSCLTVKSLPVRSLHCKCCQCLLYYYIVVCVYACTSTESVSSCMSKLGNRRKQKNGTYSLCNEREWIMQIQIRPLICCVGAQCIFSPLHKFVKPNPIFKLWTIKEMFTMQISTGSQQNCEKTRSGSEKSNPINRVLPPFLTQWTDNAIVYNGCYEWDDKLTVWNVA